MVFTRHAHNHRSPHLCAPAPGGDSFSASSHYFADPSEIKQSPLVTYRCRYAFNSVVAGVQSPAVKSSPLPPAGTCFRDHDRWDTTGAVVRSLSFLAWHFPFSWLLTEVSAPASVWGAGDSGRVGREEKEVGP